MKNSKKGFIGFLAIVCLFFAEHIRSCTPEIEDTVRSASHSNMVSEVDKGAEDFSRDREARDINGPNNSNSESNAQDESRPKTNETSSPSDDDVSSRGEAKNTEPLAHYDAKNEKLKEKGCYLTDKKLSDEEIFQLSDANIHFVLNKELYDLQTSQTYFTIMIVSSDDINEMQLLYDVDSHHAKTIRKLFDQLRGYENVRVVTSEDQLKIEIEASKARGAQPVVIFHNKNNTLYNKPVNAFSTSVITCNSYQLNNDSKKFLYSTEFLGIKNVVLAVKQAQNKENLFEFYSTFCNVYHKRVLFESRAKMVYVAAGVVGTGGGMGLVYYNSKS